MSKSAGRRRVAGPASRGDTGRPAHRSRLVERRVEEVSRGRRIGMRDHQPGPSTCCNSVVKRSASALVSLLVMGDRDRVSNLGVEALGELHPIRA